jgi:hypothetical protein
MSVVFTPEMFALLDSKTKQKMLAVASGTVNEKPKKVLSPEHLAKLKAGREAAAAKKAAEKATADVAAPEAAAPAEAKEKVKKILSPEHLAKLKAGREAAKAKKEAAKAELVAVSIAAELVGHGEVPESVIEAAAVADAKPKKVLSPEHLAKLKAGREAAKAKKAAEKAAEKAVSEAQSSRSSSPKVKSD